MDITWVLLLLLIHGLGRVVWINLLIRVVGGFLSVLLFGLLSFNLLTEQYGFVHEFYFLGIVLHSSDKVTYAQYGLLLLLIILLPMLLFYVGDREGIKRTG